MELVLEIYNGRVYDRTPGQGFTFNIPVDTRLAVWKVDAGEIPGNTCPVIDDVISDIKQSREFCCMAGRALTLQEAVNLAEKAAVDLAGNVDRMERIREANEKLRDLGVFWYEKAQELMLENCRLKIQQEKMAA